MMMMRHDGVTGDGPHAARAHGALVRLAGTIEAEKSYQSRSETLMCRHTDKKNHELR